MLAALGLALLVAASAPHPARVRAGRRVDRSEFLAGLRDGAKRVQVDEAGVSNVALTLKKG